METEFTDCSGMTVEFGSEQAQLRDCLGEGAEGAVYDLDRFNDIVAKVFKKEKRANKKEKLEAMVQDSMISPQDQADVPWTAWPIDPVYRDSGGSFLGYVMPYLDTDTHVDAQRYASQQLRWGDSTQRQRYKPAINLVLTAYWLHQNGYAIGDLSEQNIRINNGNVTLIDCDSYSIEGSDFAGEMEDPRYTPPEGRGTNHEEVRQTDQFGVTVHVFQFLMAGFHPYQAVGPGAVEGSIPEAIQQGDFPYGGTRLGSIDPPPRAPEFGRLPKPVRNGFEKCFSSGHKNPDARPSLQKWLAILSKAGGFDVGGVDLTDVTVNDEGKDRLGENWQEEIRESSGSNQTRSTTGRSTAQTDSATTASTPNDSHWADSLRGDAATGSTQKSSQQPAGQQSAGQQSGSQQSSTQQSTGSSLARIVVGFILWTTLLVVLLLLIT
jgi:hypothetical protein